MTDAETRVLARTAAVLLVVSLARYGWDARRPPATALAAGPDDGPALLAQSRRLHADDQARARPLGAGEKLDVNQASDVELDRLPGVGPAAAKAIVAARDRSGGFSSYDDLLAVPGIGPGALARMRPHLELGPRPSRPAGTAVPVLSAPVLSQPSRPAGVMGSSRVTADPTRPSKSRAPVDVNRATAAELEAVSGVGAALAARIVEKRAQLGGFGSLDDLVKVRGIGPKTLERLKPFLTVGPE